MPRTIPGKGGALERLIAMAQQYLGQPYRWGGSSPKTGFDCSGFVMWLYGQQGITLPRTTYAQYGVGTPIPKSALRPGDIVFFEPSKGGPGHEGLYIGHGMFIESPHTGASIRISSLSGRRDYVGARRIIPGGAASIGELVGLTSGQQQQTQKTKEPRLVNPLANTGQITGFKMPGEGPTQPFSPDHFAETWQQIASQASISDETRRYAQNAQVISGANSPTTRTSEAFTA